VRSAARWIAPAVAAPWVLWAVGRTLGLDRVHPLVAIVAFTPYAAATSPLPVLAALVLRRRVVAAVAAIATLLLAAAVLPRASGEAVPAPPGGRTITVMSSNLFHGRADARRVMELVRAEGVDVLVLTELDAAALARLDDAGLRDALPGRALSAGNGIFARGEVTDRGAGGGDPRAVLHATVELEGAGLTVHAVHPRPPISRAAVAEWKAVLRSLPPPGDAGPEITAGDFNATLDHRELRRVLDRGWRDAADAVGAGLRPTWPVGRRVFGIAIDHVLAGPGLGVHRYAIHEVPGTDHRAVVAELVPGEG